MAPLLVINTVALPLKHLARAPRLSALAAAGWVRPLREALPAVTCSAQAAMLTGTTASRHGIVGNGWLYRDTMEVRFWQQSNALLQAEPLYETARREAEDQGKPFRAAKLFWWFNQGARVDISVTPKPHYGADGSKAFDILATPESLEGHLKKQLGPFPFHTFWGPMAGLPCTQWIARCAACVLDLPEGPPDLTLVYLPHLDYDTQRLGPDGCDWTKRVRELDDACAPLLDAARKKGARVWIVNEYSHLQVDRPIHLNRFLREQGWLKVRLGPFGEQLDTFGSRVFAVCDHQIAHVHVNLAGEAARCRPRDVAPAALEEMRRTLAAVDGVAGALIGAERREAGLDHDRAGDIVLFAKERAWFAYPFWLDDRLAPDYARTVDIHRKPGYDPCELFFNPAHWWPRGRALRKLIGKRLGFRTLLDLVPLDASLVKGSHGLRASRDEDRPLMIGDGPPPADALLDQTAVRGMVLQRLQD